MQLFYVKCRYKIVKYISKMLTLDDVNDNIWTPAGPSSISMASFTDPWHSTTNLCPYTWNPCHSQLCDTERGRNLRLFIPIASLKLWSSLHSMLAPDQSFMSPYVTKCDPRWEGVDWVILIIAECWPLSPLLCTLTISGHNIRCQHVNTPDPLTGESQVSKVYCIFTRNFMEIIGHLLNNFTFKVCYSSNVHSSFFLSICSEQSNKTLWIEQKTMLTRVISHTLQYSMSPK